MCLFLLGSLMSTFRTKNFEPFGIGILIYVFVLVGVLAPQSDPQEMIMEEMIMEEAEEEVDLYQIEANRIASAFIERIDYNMVCIGVDHLRCAEMYYSPFDSTYTVFLDENHEYEDAMVPNLETKEYYQALSLIRAFYHDSLLR